MFLIPWNTDAPIYHGPWSTLVLMVINVAVFVGMAGDPEATQSFIQQYGLEWGHGLHPVQWLTSNFVHGDIMHLIGNMIYLWSFGLVVEGKVGWWAFLAIYLGMGVTESGLEQMVTQGLDSGGSYGASSIIFGLLAICVIWAPKNDLNCLLILGLRTSRVIDIPILTFGLLYIGWEAFLAWLGGFSPSSAILHLYGALVGFVVGIALLKLRWVDCENWDLFAVIAGRIGEPRDTAIAKPPEDKIDFEATRTSLEHALAERQGKAAMLLHQKLCHLRRDWQLPERHLLGLIGGLHAQKAWAESIPYMVEYLGRFTEQAATVRLRLAQILIHAQRPVQALKVLAKISPNSLPDEQEKHRRKLIQTAKLDRDKGIMEVEAQDW